MSFLFNYRVGASSVLSEGYNSMPGKARVMLPDLMNQQERGARVSTPIDSINQRG